MRVTIKYEGAEPLVIRVTLPEKQLREMTGLKLLELFAKQHGRKFNTEGRSCGFAVDEHFLKIVGGKQLERESLVADFLTSDAEVLVMPAASTSSPSTTAATGGAAAPLRSEETMTSDTSPSSGSPATTRRAATSNFQPKTAGAEGSSSSTAGAAAAGSSTTISKAPSTSSTATTCPEAGSLMAKRKAAESAGKLRCKNFGCNKFFDPETESGLHECRHHKAPPIFHETAKWWSCCPNHKAYDWDEFQNIPGCQVGAHSTVAAKKQVLGGVDLRESNAPQRIDNGPMEPRKKLDMLRKAMSTCGVAEDLFDKAWGQAMVKTGSLDKVVENMARACERALVDVSGGNAASGSGDVDMMD